MSGHRNLFGRRDFLRTAGAAGFAAALGALSPARLFAANGKKMNVLFIPVDDLRPELGCYGFPHIISPNLDKLASEGLIFDHAYCQQAVCGASRASLHSGLRPDTSGIFGNNQPLSQVVPDIVTLPHQFKKNGYETVMLGKIYHHRLKDDPNGWTRVPELPESPESVQGRGYVTPEAHVLIEEENVRVRAWNKENAELIQRNPGRRKKPGRGPAWECADVADDAYTDGRIATQAIAELQRMAQGEQPFFLATGFMKPHLPFNAPKKYWDLYDRDKLPLSPVRDKRGEGTPDFAYANWGELRNYVGMPEKGPVSEEDERTLIHGYYACISYMDAQVGRVLDELDRLGLRENTAVVLWGDHGWKLGDYGEWCKHTNFEVDIHVPMIWRVPGVTSAGTRCKSIVEFIDIYPTLCDVCGLEIPAHVEGDSLTPLFKNPERSWKLAAFSFYPRGGNRLGHSVRAERYHLVRWMDRGTKQEVAVELYDLETDPHEVVNLAVRPEHAETLDQMRRMQEAGWRGARPR